MSYRLIQGSAHDMREIADKSVHLCVTSPPYMGLRSYAGDQGIEWPTVEYSPMPGLPPLRIQGCEPDCEHEWGNQLKSAQRLRNGTGSNTVKQPFAPQTELKQGAYCIHCGGWRGPLGLEPTIEAYIGHLVLVLREIYRVLRTDGTCWFNLGDSMNGSGGAHAEHHANPGISKSAYRDGTGEKRNLSTEKFHGGKAHLEQRRVVGSHGLPPKNMLLIPARFALAAQADGWIVRSAMPWIKRSGMPESVTDRPGQVVESIFLLAKSERYYFDMEAVRQPATGWMAEWRAKNGYEKQGPKRESLYSDRTDSAFANKPNPTGRNFRSSDLFFKTWQGLLSSDDGDPLAMVVNPVGFSGAHFACFPPLLPEIAIKASTSAHGVCSACGAPWERVVERETRAGTGAYNAVQEPAVIATKIVGTSMRGNPGKNLGVLRSATTGWEPTCECNAGEPIPATVLDPFNGSGTTGRAALALGRSYIGVDLSQEYISDLAPDRLSNVQIEMAF